MKLFAYKTKVNFVVKDDFSDQIAYCNGHAVIYMLDVDLPEFVMDGEIYNRAEECDVVKQKPAPSAVRY